MTSLLKQAVQLNDSGISALLRGNKVLAIRSMTAALKLLKAALANNETLDKSVPSATSRLDDMYTIELPSSIVHSSIESILFNRVFQLPGSYCDNEPTSEFDIGVYTSAVMFNLAVAHQTVGEAAFVNKAERLYEMVLRLLDDSIFLSVRSSLIVKLGCINNLSQLHYLKGDFDEFSARQRLGDITAHAMRQSFQETEIQFLLLNLVLLKPPTVAAAA